MSNKSGRLEKVTLRLTPRQAIGAWMTEAHAYGSPVAYAQSLPEQGTAAHPLNLLTDQVEQAVRQALKGEDRETMERAVRQAVQDVAYLYFLQHRLNLRVLEALPRLRHQLLLLYEQTRGLAREELLRVRLQQLRWELLQQLPYPLEPAIAAALEAACAHWVEPWASVLGEDEHVGDWVRDAYATEGATTLPCTAYAARDGDARPLSQETRVAGSDDLRELFSSEEDWADFLAGRDFRQGFADVRDAGVHQRVEEVGAALRVLATSGSIAGGALLRLSAVPIVALQEAPLVDGVWLDRTIAELDVWGALLAQEGLAVADGEDDTPLAWPVVPQEDRGPLALPLHPRASALRQTARSRLAQYRGRTQVVADGLYLQVDDYLGWRRRQRFGQAPEMEAGLPLAAWNAWIAEHGDAEQATVAGVPVISLAPWPSSACREPCLDAAAAATALVGRARLLGDLADTILNAEESETRCDQARATLHALQDEVTLLQSLADTTARRWYGGQAPLFPVVAQDLAALVAGVAHAAGLLVRTGVDTSRRDATVQRTTGQGVTDATEDLAQADGLWLVGSHDKAQAIVARVLAE